MISTDLLHLETDLISISLSLLTLGCIVFAVRGLVLLLLSLWRSVFDNPFYHPPRQSLSDIDFQVNVPMPTPASHPHLFTRDLR